MQAENEESSTNPLNLWSLSFGELDGVLAKINAIDDGRRTAFQGRLKHLLKLGALPNVKQGRGKAAEYAPGDVVTMAILCELTRFGISPEAAISLLNPDFYPIYAAILRSVDAVDLEKFPDDVWFASGNRWSMLIYFAPNAFSTLSDENLNPGLRWARVEHVQKALVEATSYSATRQLSVMNITTLLRELVRAIKSERRQGFVAGIQHWAQEGVSKELHRSLKGEWEDD